MRNLWIVCLFGATVLSAMAELPPSAYERMQKESPEVLRINILRVEKEQAATETKVALLAEVLKVGRTSTGIKQGDVINILYVLPKRPQGWSGPGAIPVPEEKTESVAYLKKIEGTQDYEPSAGRMTFSNF